MIIATRLALALTLSGASFLAVANAIADAPTSNAVVTLPIAADITNIDSRNGDGKLDTFFDTAGRKFVVLYDAAGRPVAVSAVRGRNIMDIEAIRYTRGGQVSGVAVASGYELTYMYGEDGMQVIRDRYGGILTRPAQSTDLNGATVHADPTNKLAALVSKLDALFAAIQPASRE